jgi:hypothetical protein
VTPRELLNEVKRRTLLLAIASGGELSHDEAEREAARSVIAEQRAKPRSPSRGAANPARDGVTVATARQFLTDYLSALAERMKSRVEPHAASKPVRRVLLSRPKITEPTVRAPVTFDTAPAVAPEPAPEQPPLLLFASSSTAATLLDDSQFHTSLHSRTTQAWRRSIEENERRATERQRRRSLWVG